MQDALASNAGDRYHFVYTARRMLDMLHPRSELKLIQMENVAKEDFILANESETFVGVDLTEYYGGLNSNQATRIEVVQVKYSPLNPHINWTLSRLCTDKKNSKGKRRSGTSVTGKLANAFNAFYKKFNDDTSQKIVIRIYTNQSLAPSVSKNLRKIQNLIKKENDCDASKKLKKIQGELKNIIGQIKTATGLSWESLASFLNCWDLSGFGQAMLSDDESDLFDSVCQYSSHGDELVDGLISFVQEHAIPHRSTKINREEIYRLLRLRETDFFPAPSYFESPERLIYTNSIEKLIEEVEKRKKGFLLFHGISGTGKSVALQLSARNYGDGSTTIIYDCFAGGSGLIPGSERFPYYKFFVQIVNELDSLLHTNIFATTSLKYDHLMDRFNEALLKAALKAREKGQRLIIAIDAIDNAIKAASRNPIKSGECFVPYLWNLTCPDNCIIIFTCRTENKSDLKPTIDIPEMEIEGFADSETAEYVRSFLPNADNNLVAHIHKCTKGNPRVQFKIKEDLEKESPENIFTFVKDKAKATALEYYKEECAERLSTKKDKLLVAVLHEATQFISLDNLSNILTRSPEEIEEVIKKLYFGLQIVNREVQWRDQDFLDFTDSFINELKEKANNILSEFCLKKYEESGYAQKNLSHHLYRARKYRELINWWSDYKKYERHISKLEPYEEDVITDLKYALQAANELREFSSILNLLSVAAEILHGKNLFNYEIKEYPELAIKFNYLDRLLEFLKETESDFELANYYLKIAKAVAQKGENMDCAIDLYQRGCTIIRQESNKRERNKSFTIDNVLDIGILLAYSKGIETALKNLKRWKPQKNIYPLFSDLIKLYSYDEGEALLKILERIRLNKHQKAHCFAGLIANEKAGLKKTNLNKISKNVLDFLSKKIIDPAKIQHLLPDIIENLLFNKLKKLAKDFIQYWHVSKPRDIHSKQINDFLKIKAVKTILEIEEFDPEKYEVPIPEHLRESKKLDHYYEQEQKELRDLMQKKYSAMMLRSKALFGFKEKVGDFINETRESLAFWSKESNSFNIRQKFYFIDIASFLLEAITYFPDHHYELVAEVISTSEIVLTSMSNKGYHCYADILTKSKDNKYLAQVEHLIQRRLEEISLPDYRAGEAVEALLSLCLIVLRFDQKWAYSIFSQARTIAKGWDGNFNSRAFALLSSAERAQDESRITEKEIPEIAAVFEYAQETALEDTITRLDEALRLIGRVNPSFALDFSKKLDDSMLLDIKESIGGLSLGLLNNGSISPHVLWPLTHFLDSIDNNKRIFYESVLGLLKDNGEVEKPLQAFEKQISRNLRKGMEERTLKEIINWFHRNNLQSYKAVQKLEEFLKDLQDIGISKDNNESYLHYGKIEPTSLFRDFQKKLKESPQQALETLKKAETNELEQLQASEIKIIVDNLIERISSNDVSECLSILKVWGSSREDPLVFDLIIKFIEKAKTFEKVINSAEKTLEELLTPDMIGRICNEYYYAEDYLDKILKCKTIFIEKRLEIILSPVIKSLEKFGSRTLYWLIGHLVNLISPEQALNVFENLLKKSLEKIPKDKEFLNVSKLEPLQALIKYLSDLLGDPRQDIRWRTLYTLVDIITNEPKKSLNLLIAELQDETHQRWMTKREWLLFTLHHISLIEPSSLLSFKDIILEYALNKKFPHAKIRYHAKEILLNIEKSSLGALSQEELLKVNKINQPLRFITKDDLGGRDIPYKGVKWGSKKDKDFTFDFLDTMPYWYSPLSGCFALHRCHIADIAYKWIVDKWKITDEICKKESLKNRSKYHWEQTSNRHGSEPSVEDLRTYAEKHGMFMAAGELIDSKPVFSDGEREGDRWKEYWARYRLIGADPSLPGKLVKAPPVITDNYGVFNDEYEEWVKKEKEKDFKDELLLKNDPCWVVVASYRGGSFFDRNFKVHVDSSLISPKTSKAFVSFVNSQISYVSLPIINLQHDSVLPELEFDLKKRSDYYIRKEEVTKDEEGLFELRDWLVSFYQEMPYHSFDPKYPKNGRSYFLLGMDFCNRLNVSREPIALRWRNNNNETIAYHDTWYRYYDKSEYSDYAEGYRLVVRKDAITSYLKAKKLDMIFVVTLSRQRPYLYHRDREYSYDRGTQRVYLLNSRGMLR